MDWIEDNVGKIFLIFLTIFVIEMGIGVWRMPREFRQNIIPKLENAVNIEQRLNHILEIQEMRINLLSEIQQRQTTKAHPDL
jgi:hypothetical protein